MLRLKRSEYEFNVKSAALLVALSSEERPRRDPTEGSDWNISSFPQF